APGTFFLWMGVAAFIVGASLWAMPDLSWQAQFIIFALFSVASIVAWRMWAKKHPETTDQPNLNRRGEQYVGRVFTLVAAIENGTGKIRVDDSTWKVRGEDAEVGSKVKVTGADGVILLVEPAP
ncbi:MAG: NfeD family protein, partial [Gammaproteobacteria bacterium]